VGWVRIGLVWFGLDFGVVDWLGLNGVEAAARFVGDGVGRHSADVAPVRSPGEGAKAAHSQSDICIDLSRGLPSRLLHSDDRPS